MCISIRLLMRLESDYVLCAAVARSQDDWLPAVPCITEALCQEPSAHAFKVREQPIILQTTLTQMELSQRRRKPLLQRSRCLE